MREITDHSFKAKGQRFKRAFDLKMIAAIVAVEFGMYLMAVYKGVGSKYWPVVLFMTMFTVTGSVIVNFLNADKMLFVSSLVLLSLGFLVQQITDYDSVQISLFLKKLIISLVTAFITGIIYVKTKKLMSNSLVVFSMMFSQIGIGITMLICGKFIGGSQGATIVLKGITPFEIVKLLYIFVAAGLLVNGEKIVFHIKKITVDRELLLIIHTALLSVFFVLCSELGTLMIVWILMLLMLWVFGKNRKRIYILTVLTIVGCALIWLLSDKYLLPLIESGKLILPGAISKIIRRFGTALHPEFYMHNYGYQGTNGLQAIAIGGWLGIPTERYRIDLPEANNDFVFANIIQTCGFLTGIIVILFFVVLLKTGIKIAQNSQDEYLKQIAGAITFVIIIETLVHIGYNTAAFPIAGIPLYFISQGFTAILTGMMLLAILLVISADQNKKRGEEYDNTKNE